MTPTVRGWRVGADSEQLLFVTLLAQARGVMKGFLVIFLGAGLGGALRHGVNVSAAKLMGTGFPVGTLFVNVVGSFVMGLFIEWFALKEDPGQTWRLFLTTGILGGFTTFSAFSLETVLFIQRDAYAAAAFYVLISVLASIAGLIVGLIFIREFA